MSLYWNYPQNIRNIRMYSVLYPESNFGRSSGLVLEWFRKRSIYRLRMCWGNLMRIQFPESVSAKICIPPSVVLNSYFGGPSKCLKEYVGFPHISSITRSWGFRKVYVCVP